MRVRRTCGWNGVRRLHRRLEPHPPDGECRQVRLRSNPRAFPPGVDRGADLEARRAGPRGGADRSRGRVRAPRPVDGGAHPGQSATMTRAATVDRTTGETEVHIEIELDGDGSGE